MHSLKIPKATEEFICRYAYILCCFQRQNMGVTDVNMYIMTGHLEEKLN